MLSQSPTEAQTALFLKNYLECVEELPCDLIKKLSRVRELTITTNNMINETEELTEKIMASEGEVKRELMNRLKDVLIKLQDIKSEKLLMSTLIQETVESKARSIEVNFKNDIATNNYKTEECATTITEKKNTPLTNQIVLPSARNVSKQTSSASSSASETNNSGNDKGGVKRLRRATRLDTELERAETPKASVVKIEPTTAIASSSKEKAISSSQPAASASLPNNRKISVTPNASSNGKKKLKKKKKALSSSSSKQSSTPSIQEPISIDDENDDEETYCLCEQVSYGEMIACENDGCKIEWFHFSCVSLKSKPKGKWYCPSCRGDRPNVLNKTLRKKS